MRPRRALQKLGIVGMDGDDDRPYQGMGKEHIQRMRNDGTTADALILLRAVGLSGARTAAGGDDHHPDPAAWGRRLLFACLAHSDRS
ncbi:hypothetical protein MPLSOD_100079 [Mesorhizobium sp. SOD10]|jgi:hypothetical protein|nr:hypothetical protein MPLSOD_100079 [Mesorhizobium sp. SOD10]